MESPRKFNDCYFYYYSTCTKGDNCVFRHEPSALGCETMCTAWQQGKCLDKRCKLRHMELRKNRKQIPCYWENQPGGCRKKHCPFMHKNPDARTDGIAPSQPQPQQPAAPTSVPEATSPESTPSGVMQPVPPVPAPQPVPMLWQQRQAMVLDSAILGVLPASSELLGARRVVPHEPAPNPYAPMPVDPLVVNFEEESDNESAPSSTPTKTVSPDDAQRIARTKSQELLLLEKIQAEAAAFYSYDAPSSAETSNERKIVRTNLSTKYDRLSLDEISGKKQSTGERRSSLDFKVLSLEEIRAKKKGSDCIELNKPIALNLNRKRKLSTQETITTSGNKMIKVVRSNSVVYKKVDPNAASALNQVKVDQKQAESETSRKRTLSEQCRDIYDLHDDELIDNCFEFKKIKLTEKTFKPKLNRNVSVSNASYDPIDDLVGDISSKTDNDSDSEVQIVSVEMGEIYSSVEKEISSDVIDVESTNLGEPIDIVDLCADPDESDVPSDDIDLDNNVPDVVASCQRNSNKVENSADKDVISDIDALLNEEL